ncbi:hypothetical protein [Actinocorallia herbida]|nr:hypothetical protein [Actinocorallia herbida]
MGVRAWLAPVDEPDAAASAVVRELYDGEPDDATIARVMRLPFGV